VVDGASGSLPIIYRDDSLIAVHKPAGLLVHRSVLDRHETRFALQMLRDQVGQLVYPVHRIDKGTSGLLLFALDREVGRLLYGQFERGEVEKRYIAVVRGHPPESGDIDHPLTRMADEHAGIAASAATQPAQTRFRRLATVELPYRVDCYPTSRYALVELQPLTGRWHQLRRHMKHIAHPIIGDATHGKGRHNRLFQELFGRSRLLLAATEMRLVHPVSGQALRLQTGLAEDFAEVIGQLGWREPSGCPPPSHNQSTHPIRHADSRHHPGREPDVVCLDPVAENHAVLRHQ
jgi:tRNA pseudouridine65 synthase